MEGYSGLSEEWVHLDIPSKPITVRTERLDDNLPDGWLPDFVKIDVEGAERLVFEGAMRTFRLVKPTIAFEHGWTVTRTSSVRNRSTNSSPKTCAYVCSRWMAAVRWDYPSSLMVSEADGTGLALIRGHLVQAAGSGRRA